MCQHSLACMKYPCPERKRQFNILVKIHFHKLTVECNVHVYLKATMAKI